MPAIQKEVSVAAAGTNDNVFSGSAFEFARTRVLLSLGVTAAATGSFITINSGSDVLLEESAPYVATLFPVVPDQMFYNDVMEQGDRLVLRVRNPTAGAIIHRAIALMTAVA